MLKKQGVKGAKINVDNNKVSGFCRVAFLPFLASRSDPSPEA
jgi:hypothetical protein